MQNSNRIFYLFVPSLVFIFIFLCIVGYVGVFEDAFISFRYANNLATGQGLVFNAGEYVWGYSNFLWTVLLALGITCGFSIVAFAKYLGVLAALLIIVALFYWLLKRSSNNNFYLAFASSFFLVTSTHFLIASQNGLETVFFTLLIFLGILFLIDAVATDKNYPWYAVCFLLASMTRPEGPLFMVIAGLIEVFLFIRVRKKITLQRLGLSALIFTVGYVVYILFMYAYYGALLPNAFFVKVDLNSSYQIAGGIKYLCSFCNDIKAIFLFWPLLFVLTDRQRVLQNAVLIFFSTAYLLFVIRVGGDFQVYFYRFIIPVMPLLFLLLGNAIIRMCELFQLGCPNFANLICVVIVGCLISINFFAVQSPVIPFFSQTAKRTPIVVENLAFLLRHPGALKSKASQWFSSESMDIQPMDMVGKVLAEKLEPGASVATGQCGQIPFYLHQRRVLDMIGLMDDEAARQGMSLTSFKKSAVDYCIFFYSEAENYFIPLTLYPELINSDYFRTHYKMEHIFRHRSIFPDRSLYSEKYMLLFKKREKPASEKKSPYILREHIDICFKNGNFTDLKCNLNGLQRGQFISTNAAVSLTEKKDFTSAGFSPRVGVEGWSGVLPARLDDKHSQISFSVEKFVHEESYQVWSHVKLSAFADYDRVKMSVFATDIRGVRTKVGNARSLHTILSPGYALAAWLPLICRVPVNTAWRVVIEVVAGGRPIYVDKLMLVKDPLWLKSQFEKL